MIEVEHLEAFNSDKILSFEDAVKKVAELKAQGKKVGLCHGGFDLLHPGQMKHFESAKSLCDVLLVSVTADKFVSSRKGSGRPVYHENLRCYTIATQEAVDFVVVTPYKTGVEVIESLKPSYYIKGPDYINKTTPGITREREAIAHAGGEMKYTNDPKLSTTSIINYVKEELDRKKLLVGIDRDGTLIANINFLGRDPDWKDQIKFLNPVIDFLIYLQTKFDTTFIVITNQSGVARTFFDCARVEEINSIVDSHLKEKNVIIDNWQYCPDADAAYAEKMKGEIDFDPKHVKEKTRRKPDPAMLLDGLKEIDMKLEDFGEVLILGDRHEDENIAKEINARFINVENKSYDELVKELGI